MFVLTRLRLFTYSLLHLHDTHINLKFEKAGEALKFKRSLNLAPHATVQNLRLINSPIHKQQPSNAPSPRNYPSPSLLLPAQTPLNPQSNPLTPRKENLPPKRGLQLHTRTLQAIHRRDSGLQCPFQKSRIRHSISCLPTAEANCLAAQTCCRGT